MTPTEMKALVLKCMRGFSSGDLSQLEGCFHDDYQRHVTPGLKGVSSFAEHVADLIESPRGIVGRPIRA